MPPATGVGLQLLGPCPATLGAMPPATLSVKDSRVHSVRAAHICTTPTNQNTLVDGITFTGSFG